jgi:excisionase family DNA binding protein
MHALSDSQSARAKRSNLEAATYSLADLAALLGISYSTAHERARAGELPVTPLKLGRQYLFPKRTVDKLLGLDDVAEPQDAA